MDDEEETEEMESQFTIKEEYILDGTMMRRKSPAWRVPLSTAVGIGWLVFVIIWLFFYAGGFHIYQNIAIVLLSLLVSGLILGTAWATFVVRNMNILEEFMMEIGGFKWRIIFSLVIIIGLVVFMILWLYFFATDFDVYQNIAIAIVSVLVMLGMLGGMWASWGMRQGKKYEQWKWE
ncbi:MAG: hypothetical protein JSV43_03040 [Methanobacteriota archaeon]|nr:MAG: hypothetical protein JSV43_03040 [Euryarchaeota archaeon]